MPGLRNRQAMQARFGREMGKLNAKFRKELLRLAGDPPDISRVPPEFWQRVQRESEDEMTALMVLIFAASAGQHGMPRDSAQFRGEQFAAHRAGFVADGLASGSRTRLLDAQTAIERHQARTIAETGRISTAAAKDLRIRIANTFGTGRAAGIATTETTAAETGGINAAVEDQPPDIRPLRVWFLGPCRHCTFCPLVAGTEHSFWSQFISGPPAHVRCCCTIELVPAGTRTKPPPSVATVQAAARQSGVFGYLRARTGGRQRVAVGV